jgi:hypothetical protein
MNKNSSLSPFFTADGHWESVVRRTEKIQQDQSLVERRRRVPKIQQYTS